MRFCLRRRRSYQIASNAATTLSAAERIAITFSDVNQSTIPLHLWPRRTADRSRCGGPVGRGPGFRVLPADVLSEFGDQYAERVELPVRDECSPERCARLTRPYRHPCQPRPGRDTILQAAEKLSLDNPWWFA